MWDAWRVGNITHTHLTNVNPGTYAPKAKALQAEKPNHACENRQADIISQIAWKQLKSI